MTTQRLSLSAGLLIVLLTFLLFSPTLQYPFVNWDDNAYVYQNPRFRPLTFDHLVSFFTKPYFLSWTPVTMLSHAADVAVWDFNPYGHHLTNVLLHSVNAGLVFWLALQLFAAFGWKGTSDQSGSVRMLAAGAVAALLFALHPLRAESVAWVSDRKDLLSTFFMLLTSLVFVQRREGRRGSYALVVVLYALALGSKTTAMMLPFVFMMMDGTLYRPGFRTSVREMAPLILLAAGAGVMARAAAPEVDAGFIMGDRTALQLVAFPFTATFFYLTKWIIPVDLSPVYHTRIFLPSINDAMIYLAPAAIVALAVLCITQYKKGRGYWLAAFGAFLLFLLPTFLGLFSGIQPVADRYTYAASVSLCILTGAGVGKWLESFGGRLSAGRSALLLASCVIVLSILSLATRRQMELWSDPLKLWTYVLQRAPFPLAYNNAGMIYLDQGKHAEAIASFKKAVDLRPAYGEALCNLGIAYKQSGDTLRAIEAYRTAMRVQPDHLDSYINLGTEYLTRGFVDSAVGVYRAALAVDSTFSPAYYNIALALMKEGRYADAVVEHKKALALAPVDADAWYNLGVAYERLSLRSEGIEAYERAIDFRRDYLDAYINLGNLYAAQGDPDRALEIFGRAIRVNPQSPDVFYNLGYVLYSVGETGKAISSFEVAIRNDSTYAPAYHNLGVMYGQRGDSARAVSYLRQGARLGFEQSRQMLQQKGINW